MPNSSPLDAAPDTLSVEERMRRALGLTGDRGSRGSPPRTERPQAGPQVRPASRPSADKPRHRFVQDGDVPVTVLNRHRPDEAEGLSASRTAAEAALQDALATVHDLQTKLGHAELAHWELSATAQAARAEADALRAEHQEQALRWTEDLAAERATRLAAEASLAEATRAREPAKRTRVSAPAAQPALDLQDTSPALMAKAPDKPAAKRARKAASEPRRREPQPVKWWLQSARKGWP